jgi:hypothetical protein
MQTLTDEQAASLPAWLRALGEREKSLSLSRDGSSCEISLPVKFLATAADIFTQTITLPETNYGLDIDWESNSAGVPVIRWDRDSQVHILRSRRLTLRCTSRTTKTIVIKVFSGPSHRSKWTAHRTCFSACFRLV